jgi:hypothetical protein
LTNDGTLFVNGNPVIVAALLEFALALLELHR